MLAPAAGTGEPVRSITSRWVKPFGEQAPRPGRAAFYDERFARYRRLYPALRELDRLTHIIE